MKKLIAGLVLSAASGAAFAGDWSASAGYTQIDASSEFDLGALELSAVYQFESDSNYTNGIEISFAYGVSDDSVDTFFGDVTIELDNFISVSYLGQVDFNETVYGLVSIGYARAEAEASGFGASASDSENDYVFGVGLGFNISEGAAIELDYRDTGDDIDFSMIGLGIRFDF